MALLIVYMVKPFTKIQSWKELTLRWGLQIKPSDLDGLSLSMKF